MVTWSSWLEHHSKSEAIIRRMPAEDGTSLLPNHKGLCGDPSIEVWQNLHTAPLPATDTSTSIRFVASYSLSAWAACKQIWALCGAFSYSESPQNWQSFTSLTKWIGPKWWLKCFENPNGPGMHCASVTKKIMLICFDNKTVSERAAVISCNLSSW